MRAKQGRDFPRIVIEGLNQNSRQASETEMKPYIEPHATILGSTG